MGFFFYKIYREEDDEEEKEGADWIILSQKLFHMNQPSLLWPDPFMAESELTRMSFKTLA